MLHHPDTFDHRTQLFDPTWLAAVYRVGFQMTGLAINEEGDHILVDIDEYPGSGLSFRRIGLEHGFDHAISTTIDRTDWSDDTAAVDALAEDILINDTDGSQYYPWYQTGLSPRISWPRRRRGSIGRHGRRRRTERPSVNPTLEVWTDQAVGHDFRSSRCPPA